MKNSKDKIVFERTPKQIEMLQKLGSKNRAESFAAQEALAAALSQPILYVIEQAPVLSNQFQKQVYDVGTPPSIPLDPFFDVKARNFLQIWGQTGPGGNATNLVQGMNEVYVQTYELFSAYMLEKRWLRGNRIDVLQAVVNRLINELLIKRNNNAANILMYALANARIDGNAGNTATGNLQLSRTQTAGVFSMVDFNQLVINYARTVTSFVGGTPLGARARLDTLIGSPEWLGQIRSIAYQPVNTRSGSTASSGATSLAAPDSVREQLYNTGGIPSIFGVDLLEYNEFGINQPYNITFSNAIGSQAYSGFAGSGTATFSQTTEQIIVALNTSMFDLVCLKESDGGSEFTLVPDDSQNINVRSDNLGAWGSITEGYISVDNRSKLGISM